MPTSFIAKQTGWSQSNWKTRWQGKSSKSSLALSRRGNKLFFGVCKRCQRKAYLDSLKLKSNTTSMKVLYWVVTIWCQTAYEPALLNIFSEPFETTKCVWVPSITSGSSTTMAYIVRSSTTWTLETGWWIKRSWKTVTGESNQSRSERRKVMKHGFHLQETLQLRVVATFHHYPNMLPTGNEVTIQ